MYSQIPYSFLELSFLCTYTAIRAGVNEDDMKSDKAPGDYMACILMVFYYFIFSV